MMYYDETTLARIERAHHRLRDKMKADYLDCNNQVIGNGARLRFSQVYRSFKTQNELYAQGRTKPGRIVTNARAGQSYHNYGLAFDIVMLYDNDHNGSFEEASWSISRDGDNDSNADWGEVVDFFKSRGWEWGGDWISIKDKPHFQIRYGYHWSDLLAKHKEGNMNKDGYVII